MKQLFYTLCLASMLCGGCTDKDKVSIDNGEVKLEFDLKAGTYRGIDLSTGQVCLYDAAWQVNGFLSTMAEKTTCQTTDIQDSLGTGRSITLRSVKAGQPDLEFEFRLYDGQPFVIMCGGVDNRTDSAVQIKELSPLWAAKVFEGCDLSKNFRLVDGEGGGAATFIRTEPDLSSQNNFILHFGPEDDFHSMVGGGVSYAEFAKYVKMGEDGKRQSYLESHLPDGLSLVSYWDLGEGDAESVEPSSGPLFSLSSVQDYKFESSGAYKEAKTVVWADNEIRISLDNLAEDSSYVVAMTWCEEGQTRRQEVCLEYDGKQVPLLENRQVPSLEKKESPEIVYFQIPKEANGAHPQLVVRATGKNNVVISELIAYQGEAAPGLLDTPRQVEAAPVSWTDSKLSLYAADPVGKRVDAQSSYRAEKDLFYMDFVTRNPLYASEMYAQTLKKLQHIDLNYYYFPTICLWYAMMPIYGGDMVMGTNDAPGAVEEMRRVKDSGFLKYTTMGIRLVPDCYAENNENGWWDDEHWRMHGSGKQMAGMELKGAHYRAPYDTSKKWAQAVRDLGGLPFIYFQTAVRSRDYAEAFPEHMLFNESFHEVDTWDWLNKNYTTYDFTDEGFVKHMQDVYRNLHEAGLAGMMFDYPYTGWPIWGGMDDKYSTAASAYRTVFKLASEGLGKSAYIHERNLTYGSDIALGYVASQRTWGDTDIITPEMVMRSGLRWYKNRVVVNYDMDAKNLLKATPSDSDDGLNALLTMSYVTASRLLLANSFGTLNAKHVYKLSRIYPFHQFAQSARPLDAFVADYPRVYGMKITDQWESLTFFNEDKENSKDVSICLSGIEGRGGMGLDESKQYYVYDFWNDCLVGVFGGKDTLTQTLRRGEARQMAVREVLNHPQVLSTDRHLLQGALELSEISWNSETKELTGCAELVEGEPMQIVLAVNGFVPQSCLVSGNSADSSMKAVSDNVVKLSLKSRAGGKVQWKVSFSK